MSIKKQLIVALLLLVVGGIVVAILSSHRTPPRRAQKTKVLPVVKTMVVHPVHYRVVIHAYGEVKTRNRAIITSQVRGDVVYVSSHFYPGCAVKKGECLIKLDRRDLEIARAQARAQLKKALADMAELREEALQAMEEWKIIHPHKTIPPLVAKIPQMDALRAKVEAARSDLRLAELNLERTQIDAPFNGIVISRNVDLGQLVSPGERLGVIYSSSMVEVYIPLSLNQVQWLNIPGYNVPSSLKGGIEISFNLGNKGIRYRGNIVRCLGEIDSKSRMLYVIARVEDPFKGLPPLLPNTFVDVKIKGREIYPAFVLPLSAIHSSRVFKVRNNRIEETRVEVVYNLKDKVVVRQGLGDGDRVVISPLSGDVNGIEVRVEK